MVESSDWLLITSIMHVLLMIIIIMIVVNEKWNKKRKIPFTNWNMCFRQFCVGCYDTRVEENFSSIFQQILDLIVIFHKLVHASFCLSFESFIFHLIFSLFSQVRPSILLAIFEYTGFWFEEDDSWIFIMYTRNEILWWW